MCIFSRVLVQSDLIYKSRQNEIICIIYLYSVTDYDFGVGEFIWIFAPGKPTREELVVVGKRPWQEGKLA